MQVVSPNECGKQQSIFTRPCLHSPPPLLLLPLLQQPRAALLDPPPFDPSKLRVEYLPGVREQRLGAGRRYTLTHNDVTGSLQLSIGALPPPVHDDWREGGWGDATACCPQASGACLKPCLLHSQYCRLRVQPAPAGRLVHSHPAG